MKKPWDVKQLNPGDSIPVKHWNWTEQAGFEGLLRFELDERKNVSGTFHYSFPVFTPEQMPKSNLWQVRLCSDAQCDIQLLNVPVPGFFFGEEPAEQLEESEVEILLGGRARRCGVSPWAWLPFALNFAWLFTPWPD